MNALSTEQLHDDTRPHSPPPIALIRFADSSHQRTGQNPITLPENTGDDAGSIKAINTGSQSVAGVETSTAAQGEQDEIRCSSNTDRFQSDVVNKRSEGRNRIYKGNDRISESILKIYWDDCLLYASAGLFGFALVMFIA